WRRASLRAVGKTFLIPLAASLATGGVLLGLGFDSSWPGLLAYTFSAFVHAAVLLLAIGIAGSSAYQTVRERGLRPGQSLELAGYTLRYDALQTRKTANAVETRAVVTATRGSSTIGTLHPGTNFYPVAPGGPQTSNEVSIYHDPRNLGDLFLIADQIDKNG